MPPPPPPPERTPPPTLPPREPELKLPLLLRGDEVVVRGVLLLLLRGVVVF